MLAFCSQFCASDIVVVLTGTWIRPQCLHGLLSCGDCWGGIAGMKPPCCVMGGHMVRGVRVCSHLWFVNSLP